MTKEQATGGFITNKSAALDRSVCVAIDFNEHTSNLVKVAQSLCLKTGMRLRLINVCEPWIENMTLGFVPVPVVSSAIQFELEAKAKSELRRIAEQVSKEIRVETQVLSGPIAESLIADATVNHAAVIICGRQNPEKTWDPLGLSSALALMAHSPVPVLAIPQGQAPDFVNEQSMLIIGDDLSVHGEPVVEQSVGFALAIDAHITHLHVIPENDARLQTTLDLTVVSREIYEAMRKDLEAKLVSRRDRVNKKFKAPAYFCQILDGDVTDAIITYAEKLKAKQSILVFGRHQRVHFKPFGLGKAPFKAIVKSKYPLLIIPA